MPVVMLLLVRFVPALAVTLNGSSRWLNLGFITIQPSEVAKMAVVMMLSSVMRHWGWRKGKSFDLWLCHS